MNNRNLQFFKRLLTENLADALRNADCNASGLQEEGEVRPDPVDQASHITERKFSDHLCDRNNARIREIERSLQDIEDGVYGTCESCGEDISYKRLKARPVAKTCIDCKTQLETVQRQTGNPSK